MLQVDSALWIINTLPLRLCPRSRDFIIHIARAYMPKGEEFIIVNACAYHATSAKYNILILIGQSLCPSSFLTKCHGCVGHISSGSL